MTREKMKNMTQAERDALALELEAKRNAHHRAADESWERSDTDGFLTQWACGLSAQENNEQARLLRAGGKSTFRVLADLDGNEVRTKEITVKNPWSYQYERVWMVLDADGRRTGEFIPTHFTNRSKHSKKYQIITVEDWAWARVTGVGHGLSGTCWVETYRLEDR